MASPDYLRPYQDSCRRHGDSFGSLLWASPDTQALRFDAILPQSRLHGRSVLDAGCGRADLLRHILDSGIEPSRYIGIEAMEVLAAAARKTAAGHPTASILSGDFVKEPGLLDQSADVIVFSGSLNTLPTREFYATLHDAWKATRGDLAFNFLSSPARAAQAYLAWRPPRNVLAFAASLGGTVEMDDSYLDGDCLVVVRKSNG